MRLIGLAVILTVSPVFVPLPAVCFSFSDKTSQSSPPNNDCQLCTDCAKSPKQAG